MNKITCVSKIQKEGFLKYVIVWFGNFNFQCLMFLNNIENYNYACSYTSWKWLLFMLKCLEDTDVTWEMCFYMHL